jgi:hypothetical protein
MVMSAATTHKKSARPLYIALVLSLLMLLIGIHAVGGVTAATVFRRMVVPLVRLLLVIGMGLAVGQLIEAAGWTKRVGIIGEPLFRFARLGPRCSASFTTAFFSGAAANAMLYDYWKENKITRYQLILTNLANQFPAFLLHLPTTVFIVLPLTGWAGVFYFIVTFIAALVRLLLILLLGHKKPAVAPDALRRVDDSTNNREKKAPLWPTLKQKLPRRLMDVATYVVPIYVAVFLLNSAGLFEWTRQWLARWMVTRVVPVEGLSLVVLSFAAEFTSGFAAAGALLKEGVLTTKEAVLALLIGNVVAFPIRALRHQLPRLMGIFAPRLGLQLLFLGQGYRIASLIVAGVAYYMIA